MVGLNYRHNAPWMMLLLEDTRSLSDVIFRANVKLDVARFVWSIAYSCACHHRRLEQLSGQHEVRSIL
jgi:hypothetical protein